MEELMTKNPELLSRRQLETIADFGSERYRIHVGPFGCGKTYALALGFGLKMATSPVGPLGYLVVGKSGLLAKSTIGDQLSELFGSNFRFSSSLADGKTKDALLFGHRIYFGGMDNKESIKRILGKSYQGILCDEVTSLSEEQFDLLQGRLRGGLPHHWFEGSCNPQGPKHWLKIKLDNDDENRYHHTKWTMDDNITSWSKKYYSDLMYDYRNAPALLARYVYGEWSAADNIVYGDTFLPNEHIISEVELLGARYKYYKIGVDFGMENPTVALLCGVMPGGEHVILREWYKPHAKNLDECIQNIIKMYQTTPGKITGVYVDPSAAVLIKGLNQGGLWNVKKANNDVIDGIQSVNTLLTTNRLYVSSACKNTINEFSIYSYSKKDGEVVDKTNDHCMDALRYLVHTDR